MKTEGVAVIYDAVLSVPGMEDQVKVDLKLQRKDVLLLSQAIERGISAAAKGDNLLIDFASKESINKLADLAALCLEKAGITELSNKLKSLVV
ncbi:MAG: hypothetical protein P0Y49_14205 [Candidatus Pedobacter colombiensis]|uniref:Uncharacterized protein n=1 Tax=Candidatus Pedobacter colombiensis TaxID=3121371 RepID=A0AAJ5W652_9SPHI|nr:hypothetical protein [Pedobacter sp.]WEK17951.1 MAG: hypothetical protein P0Y49_14205 [Pedobacter sp.]